MNQIIVKIQQVPNLLLGFIVILILLLGLYYSDPPTTLCDIQMEEVISRLGQGFFSKDNRGGGYEAGVMIAFDKCSRSNSPGGCLDMFTRLGYLEGVVRTIPSHCGQDSSTAAIQNFLRKGLRLLAMIAWGDQPPINRYNTTSWLDTSDLGLFCRLKRQYHRLYGKRAWSQFVSGFLPSLPEAKTMERQDIFEKSLFSYPCKGLY